MHYIYNILTAGIYIISSIMNIVVLTEYVIVFNIINDNIIIEYNFYKQKKLLK